MFVVKMNENKSVYYAHGRFELFFYCEGLVCHLHNFQVILPTDQKLRKCGNKKKNIRLSSKNLLINTEYDHPY